MTSNGSVLARAVSDECDRLISAEEPLASLQVHCGGDLPGTIATPALLEIVGKARRYGMKLARTLHAQDGMQSITAWVEVNPRNDGEPGCEILLRSWQPVPLPPANPEKADRRHREINRQLAELSARLDKDQRLLTVEADAPDLAELFAAMQAGLGKPWTDFVSIEGDSHHQPMHWRLLDGANLRIEGSERHWRASLLPQESPGNDPIGFELLLTAQEPLPHAHGSPAHLQNGSPVQAIALKGVVGRDIAPVLRQPITRIIANAETIRTRLAGPLDEKYADYASDIAAAGQHLLALLDDLADLEVVESSDFTTAPDHIDLAQVARQAAGILGVRARERGITVDAPGTGESLPSIAEFRRVLQILLNLLSNAIRYSPENSLIAIRLERGDGRARVIVADQGPGLSEEDRLRVFEKFERLGRSGDGGSGLGLYISRRLARAMGGDLSVDSAPGEGACFVLELPGDTEGNRNGVGPGNLITPAVLRRLPRIPGRNGAEAER